MRDLSLVKTIVFVMMENRSFDHMLGYLSLPPYNRTDIDGLRQDSSWTGKYSNQDGTSKIAPFLATNPYTMPSKFDPPHERPSVAMHLGEFDGGRYAMNGFLKAIPPSVSNDSSIRKLVMSYFGAEQVPTNHFFASNFLVCDRWFCCLPAGTQPNRLMSMSGVSKIDLNAKPLPTQQLIYDWLTKNGISWRVYHQGIPFYTMMPKWIPRILNSDNFRLFKHFQEDLQNDPPKKQPKVIFVEPTYGDAPHFGSSTDDHAPSGVADGQEFLMQVYNAVTAVPSFWKGCVLIVTYDEHGGFFDHVSPPHVVTRPPTGGSYEEFSTLGIRVPSFVISPFVRPASVSHLNCDHTSFLKFVAEKFSPTGKYGEPVDSRPVASVSDTLDFINPQLKPPAAPPVDQYLANRPKRSIQQLNGALPTTPLQEAFVEAVTLMQSKRAAQDHEVFGPILKNLKK